MFWKALAVIPWLTLCAISRAMGADVDLPTSVSVIPGSPVEAVGCTAQRTDSEGGYLSDYYIRGNASFMNHADQPATVVVIQIHYQGAYGNHDTLLTKRGKFAPGVRIDPHRNALVAMLQPEALNIDTDGSREIDIWNTVSATCAVVGVRFEDGTVWRYGQPQSTPEPLFTPAPLAAPKCKWNGKQYVCQ